MARISAGFITILMLGWFLWPRGSDLLDREEAFFAFIIAFVFWILAEIKESDEIVFQTSTKNDIRLASQMVSYASDVFRSNLEQHDHYGTIDRRFLIELDSLIHENDIGTAFFQDRRVQPLFEDFCCVAKAYSRHMATHSSPDQFGRQTLYLRGYEDGVHRVKAEIDEANRLATLAWKRLPPLMAKIKERIPETFNEPIAYGWFRSPDLGQ